MFFILSKTLVYFIYPLTWILLLLIAQWISKSPAKKRAFRIGAIILFLIFTNEWILYGFAKWWQPAPKELPANQAYSCAILLGGFVNTEKNKAYFNTSSDRFIQAVKLYHEHKVSHILITGGSGSLLKTDFKVSDWVAHELNSVGVPDSAILVENYSRNTLENASFSKKLLDSVHLKPPYVLVTSSYHMRRSLLVFNKAHRDVVPFPCDYIAGRGEQNLHGILPSAEVLDIWSVYIKEVIGYVTYWFKLRK